MRRHLSVDIDETDAWTRYACGTPISIETHEIRYVDISGDGVPDAVEHITRREYRANRRDTRNTIRETRRLEYGIGIDGKPAGVAERKKVYTPDRPETLVSIGDTNAAVA